ncbi:MAG: hypothetical protein CVU86_06410 [Firmicutes bacterium HGW-Firmicutes-11]|jgi:hypothetical protein|nr:MAG: hypothetical protein CVU86_06410 [Firmicutes bacterium HGW-Firmicutes-11]
MINITTFKGYISDGEPKLRQSLDFKVNHFLAKNDIKPIDIKFCSLRDSNHCFKQTIWEDTIAVAMIVYEVQDNRESEG